MSDNGAGSAPRRGKTRAGFLARLSEPVDQAAATREKPQAAAPSTAPAAKKTRAEKSEAHYAQRLAQAEATGDPTAILLVHVDRVRSLRNPELTRTASAALSNLIARTPRPPA